MGQQRGFTLIELVVVMAMMALLLTLALPRYFGSLNKSKDMALQHNLKVLRVTLDQFQADKGRYPDSLHELVEQKYLRALPQDPITESSTTWRTLGAPDRDVPGIFDVRSGAPGKALDGRAYGSL